ncbi:MAG: PDR/VanB family oxidoreductase [Pseudomonadota bacterium]
MIEVRVTRKVQEALDICTYELADAAGGALPPFSAGSHIDVQIRPGLVRQYSLCNDPGESHRYLIGVLRDPQSRGGSQAMHEDIRQGDVIRISAPKNHFPLVPAQRSLLLAGGIGITPILCMAERLAVTGAAFELHYCTRSPERTAFYERIKASSFADRAHLYFDSGPAERRLELERLLASQPAQTHLYVCGPAGFIGHVVDTAQRLDWDSVRVHFEYFGAAPRETGADRAFEIRIASSGQCYTVPADRTVIDVLEEHGVQVPFSCEQGVCGTCVTRVLDGVPDHRDSYLNAAEHERNDQFTPCCSRARSERLVLDL